MARGTSRVLRVEELDELMDAPLEAPEPILDALITAAAKGQLLPELWAKLHACAARDDKASDLAFAYEHVAQDRRIKLVPPEVQSAIFLNAASYFSETFGDPDGAVSFAERALASVPTNEAAQQALEALLVRTGDRSRLAKFHADLAAHERDSDAALARLRRALEELTGIEGAEPLVIEVTQKILRLDPADSAAREFLERAYLASGKPREATKVLEQALLRDPPPPEDESFLIHEHLVDLYTDATKEPHRAVPHIESILALRPEHERCLAVAESLLENRAVAGRVAAALSDAYGKLGATTRELELLNMELKLARGPRRLEVQRRLGLLRREQGDPTGALELLGPVVAAEPGDDEVREAYVDLSLGLDQPSDAARLLSRALASCKEPDVRARVGADIGTVYLRSGDAKRAQASFQQVLEGGEDGRAMLVAARNLVDMFTESGDSGGLASALDAWVRFEPDAEKRQGAARRLAKLAEGELGDAARAITAWNALVDSPWADEALTRLTALCESTGDHQRMVEVLEKRAQRCKDRDEARQLALRAAELRTSQGRDRAEALAAWRAFIAQYGSTREAHAKMIPLLEQEQQWKELAWVLEREIELSAVEEWPALLARLAQVRLQRLEDIEGGLDAYRRALETEPTDRAVRLAVEKLLSGEATRSGAIAVLEPIYREERATAGLVRLLEAKAQVAVDASEASAHLAEATDLVGAELADPERGLELTSRGLALAVTAGLATEPWILRVDAFGEQIGAPGPRAEALAGALGSAEIDSEQRFQLARAAGEALADAGVIDRAVKLLRRALAYAPADGVLLARIDQLLAEQGNPAERLSLYQSALAQPGDARRRRQILHSLARLQAGELGDPASAAETWKLALADDPKDFVAHQALAELYAGERRWDALYAELARALEFTEGERRIQVRVRMAEVSAEAGDATRALGHYRELLADTELEDSQLENIELLANANGDAQTLRAVLSRRVAVAASEEKGALLEKLGIVLSKQLGEDQGARDAWMEGAELAEAARDDERARRLYERVLSVAPDDAAAAKRLVDLYARSEQWQKVPGAFAAMLRGASPELDAVAIVLSLEATATTAGEGEVLATCIDQLLDGDPGDLRRERALLACKARVLGGISERRDEVAAVYRRLLAADAEDTQQVADAFNVFLAGGELTPDRIDDRRFLFEWRVKHAADPVTVLMAWAVMEETTFNSPAHAIELYQRVLGLDGDRVDALSQLSRLRAAAGDTGGALKALEALRERSDAEGKLTVETTMATLHFDQGRVADALDLVESVLDASPQDATALVLVRRAIEVDSARPRAAKLLDRLAEGAETAAERREMLEALLEISQGVEELSELRGRWFARLLESTTDDDEARLAIALRGARERPHEQALWDAAERAARQLNQPEPLAEAYSAALDQPLEPQLAEELGRRMVEFTEEWFDDQGRVVELLKKVLSLSPGATWAFDRLKLAFNASGRWNDLFTLYDGALAREAEPAARIELLREASMAAKDFAADAERAIGYLEALFALTPEDERIGAALERLYERQGRLEPLIQLLKGRLVGADATARRALLVRITSLWLDLADAVSAYDTVETLIGDGCPLETTRELLERLVALPAARESMVPDDPSPSKQSQRKRARSVRHAAAERLKQGYQALGAVEDVARMVEIELELAESSHERIEGLEALVALRLEKLDDAEGAFEPTAQLVGLEPSEERYRQQLANLAEKLGLAERRAEVLVAVADGCREAEVERSLVLEAAEVRRDALDDVGMSIALFERALGLSQGQREPSLAAARALDPLLDRAGRHAQRADILEQIAELTSTMSERRRCLGEAAQVAATRLDDLPRAVNCYRLRLQDDDDDAEALDGLCDSLWRAGLHADLVQALLTRAARGGDGAREDLWRVAELFSDRLENPERAIDVWRRIESQHERSSETFQALVKLLSQQERWTDLTARIDEQVNAATDTEQRRQLLRELGTIYRSKTGELEQSLEAFVRAGDWSLAVEVCASELEDRTRARALIAHLLDLAVAAWQRGGGDDSGALDAAGAADWAITELSRRLSGEASHQAVVELMVRGHGLPFPDSRRRGLLNDAACIASDQLGDAALAVRLFQKLYAEDPADDVAQGSVARYAALLEDAGEFDALAALWEEQSRCRARAGDAAHAAVLAARAAEIAETKLSDPERALRDHRAGAALGGEVSLENLARLFEAREASLDAAHVLEWLCAQSSRESLAPRALRMAENYVRAGDSRTARVRLEAAAATALDAAPVRARLSDLYRQSEEWTPLADLLAQEATRASDGARRLELLMEAASLHVKKRNDPARAVDLLTQAVEIEPDDARVRRALADAHCRGGDFESALEVLRAQVERYGTRKPKERALVHFQLARVCLSAGRRAEAIAELDIANKIDPAHAGILQALARLAFEEGQLDRAERMYRALLLVIGRDDDEDAPNRSEALLDLSEIAQRKGDDLRAGEFVESAFEAALESDREGDALERVLGERKRYDLLTRAVEARLERAADARIAAKALADLAFLHAEHLGSLASVESRLRERAASLQDQLADAGVSDERAWESLSRVFDWLGDTDAEAKVLERRIEAGRAKATPEGAEPYYRLAALYLQVEAQRPRAVEVLERALELSPDLSRADTLLREALARDATDARIVALFERVARGSGDARHLVDALVLSARLPDASAEMIREGVALADSLEEHAVARELLESGLAAVDRFADADGVWVRLELAIRLEGTGELSRALSLREAAAPLMPPAEARETWLELARRLRQDAAEPKRAAAIYERLLEQDPADREAWQPLLEIYRELSDGENLVRVLEQTVGRVDSQEDRARLRLEQANLLLDQGHEDAAADILREIFDEDPAHERAATLLAGLLERQQQHDELVQVHVRRIDAAKDRQDAAVIATTSLKLGTLLERLGRTDDAFDAYYAVTDWKRDEDAVWRALLRLSEGREDAYLIGEMIEGLLGIVRGEEALSLTERLVELRRELMDEDGAERALELGFIACPDEPELREPVLQRCSERGDHARAASLLAQALASSSDRTLVDHLVESALQADTPADALAAVERLLGATPEDGPLVYSRARLLEASDDVIAAVDAYERAAQLGVDVTEPLAAALERAILRADPPQDAELSLKLVDLFERSGNVDAARARLAELVREGDADAALWHRLAELEVQTEHWDAAATAYRKLIALTEGDDLVNTALWLAHSCEQAGRPADARGGLERAFAVAPEREDLRERLVHLYNLLQEHRALAKLLLAQAEREQDIATRFGLLLTAGSQLLGAEDGADEGLSVLEEARNLSPESVEGAVAYARALFVLGRGQEAMTLLDEIIAGFKGRRARELALVYRQISEMQLSGGLLDEALASLTRAFEMDMKNPIVALELGQLALDLDDQETAGRAYRAVTVLRPSDDGQLVVTPEQRAHAQYQLALMAHNQGDLRRARVLVSKALSEDPAHGPAQELKAALDAAG
ncbi:MAG: tetratricopeptide repeat protein [Polyangiaceae bacterium]